MPASSCCEATRFGGVDPPYGACSSLLENAATDCALSWSRADRTFRRRASKRLKKKIRRPFYECRIVCSLGGFTAQAKALSLCGCQISKLMRRLGRLSRRSILAWYSLTTKSMTAF